MLTLLMSALLGAQVPTAADVLLDTPTPDELTRRLLAQTDRDEEEKNLEQDMERARRGGSTTPIDKAEPDTDTKNAPEGTDSAPSREERPRHKGRHAHRPAPDRFRALSEDGHGKGYYLAWGIVDWNLAGGLFLVATIVTVTGLAMLAVRSTADCYDHFNADTCKSGDMNAVRNGGVFAAGLGLAIGAGGGVVAWRAGTNIATYHDLRTLEYEHREGER